MDSALLFCSKLRHALRGARVAIFEHLKVGGPLIINDYLHTIGLDVFLESVFIPENV